jgi:hypothetical protein
VFYVWGWGLWGEMNQSLYAHMNNKRKMKKKEFCAYALIIAVSVLFG